MAQHIICIRNNGRELGNQINALAHQIVTGSIIGSRVKTVHLEYTACQDIHNIISFQFDNIHLGFLFQRHVVIDKFTERSQFFFIRQIAGQQQISHFLESETLLFNKSMNNILYIITTVEQLTRDRFQATARNTFIPHYITNSGEPDQHTCAVFIAQTAFHIKFGE